MFINFQFELIKNNLIATDVNILFITNDKIIDAFNKQFSHINASLKK